MLKSFFSWSLLTALLATAPLARAAVCADSACVEVGGQLASVDSNRSALLNALLGSLLGSSINLQVADWQALTTAQINLADVLQALQTQLSIGTPTAALDSSVDVAQFFTATATALTAEGQTAAANAAQKVAAKIGSGTIRIADLLDACSTCMAYSDVKLNALDFVTGVVEVFNYQNLLFTPTPITILGSNVGLASLGTVQLYAQIDQAPLIICHGATYSFNGAAIRLKLDCALTSVDLSAALSSQLTLLGISLGPNVAGLGLQLTRLTVYADIARVQGVLQSVDAVNQVVKVQATPGAVNIYVGSMNDSVFFTHSHQVVASDLSVGTVGALQVTVLGIPITAAVKIKALASGQSPSPANLTFSGAFPQTQVNSTSAFFVSNLVTSLTSSLTVQIDVNNTGLLTPVLSLLTSLLTNITPAVTSTIGTAVSTPLTLVLGSVVNPMLTLLGIQLGDADITVLGARRRCTYTLSGTVYKDANRNGFKDGTETGTGLTLYAKLIDPTAPTTALQAVTVDPTAGTYSFSGVSAGTYKIILDGNATLTDVTVASMPTGWVGTEQPGLVRSPVVVASDLPNLNFGLMAGTTLGGAVFRDTGTNAGTANDGILNGGETGIAGASVKLLDATNAVLDSAATGADGTFQVVIPSTVAAGAVLRVIKTNPSGFIASGATVGTTGGTYVRATDTVTFTVAAGLSYTGVNFGAIPSAQLAVDGQKTAIPGTTVTYAHAFTAGSPGSVVFSTAHTLTPVVAGWTEMVYVDTNGNGQLDAGEPAVTGAIAMTEGQVLNLIVKVFVPAAAGFSAQDQCVLTATLTATNASPALVQTVTRTDLTTAGATGTAGLTLTKAVDKASAKPGDSLTYTISFVNSSSSPVTNVQIFDATPGFTHFVSAAVGTSPAALGACTIVTPPSLVGPLSWSFTGSLAPGASGSVVFVVAVEL